MPNRIIKESICTSDTIDGLTWFEEVFFYRLIVNCDDYGRFDARQSILKARLFPLKNITDKQVDDALRSLMNANLVLVYEVEGKPYIQLVTWGEHQTIRNKRSKYPSIDEASITLESNCIQVNANVPVIQSNPIQSNPNPNPIPKKVAKAPVVYPNVKEQIFEFTENEEFRTVLNEYVNMRNKIKKAPTNYAFYLILKKLRSLSSDLEIQKDIVNQSTVNSWQDLYPLKKNYNRQFGNKSVKQLPDWYSDYEKNLKTKNVPPSAESEDLVNLTEGLFK